MKTIQIAFFAALAAAIVSSASAQGNGAVTNDLARMQGEWTLVSGSTDGQPMADQTRKQMKRVCKGDEATTTMGAQVILKAKISIDPEKKPKTINYMVTGGANNGKTQLGIYELDGDTFRSCFSAPGDPRPADFSTQPGDHRTLTVWKREKQEAPKPDPK